MKTRLRLPALLLGLGLCVARPVQADTALEFLLRRSPQATPLPQVAAVKEGRILVKGVGGDTNLDLLFSRQEDSVRIINHQQRSVMTVNEAEVERLSRSTQEMQPVLQGVAEQVAKLSPEQRQRWQALLGESISLDTIAQSSKPPAPSRLHATGRATVANIPCQTATLLQGEVTMAELCLAEGTSLKIPAQDYDTIQALFALYERLAVKSQRLAGQMGLGIPALGMADMHGLPIRITDHSRDDSGSLTLRQITTTAIPAERLRLPEGYQAKPLSLWQ